MGGGSGGFFQCKICQDEFNSTAELLKHRRLNHRNSKDAPVAPAPNTVPPSTPEK